MIFRQLPKTILGIFLGLLLSSHALTQSLIPESCEGQIDEDGLCFVTRAGPFIGPFEIDLYYLIFKKDGESVEDLVEKFLAFDKWPIYIENSGSLDLKMPVAVTLSDVVSTEPGFSQRTIVTYSETIAKGPAIMGHKMEVKAALRYRSLQSSGSAHASFEYELLKSGDFILPGNLGVYQGPQGLKEQIGRVTFYDSEACEVCEDGEVLMVYNLKMESNPSLLPRLGASYTRDNLELIFSGMFD